ncbi:hypothetical protein C8Q76DRAFT_616005 [Earliella scabrosa]|nr:hypothetical protein C8Q76DRAFT_616005 [Earliella scabrosa]
MRTPHTDPYHRLQSRRAEAARRRKLWNHKLERRIFSTQEITAIPAPQRRAIYTPALEAHVDRLHDQLLSHALFPVPADALQAYHGLNSTLARSMIAGLQYDISKTRLEILELERAVSHPARGQIHPSTDTPASDKHTSRRTASGGDT